jgi:hypothetical protein
MTTKKCPEQIKQQSERQRKAQQMTIEEHEE